MTVSGVRLVWRRRRDCLRSGIVRGRAGLALEDYGHVFGVGVTGEGGDLGEGEVGLGQELFDALELDGADLGLGGAAQVLAELSFEEASGEGGVAEDVLHGEAGEGAFADEAEGGGDGGVVDGE